MLRCLVLVRHRHTIVIVCSIHVFVIAGVSAIVERVVHAIDLVVLVHVSRLEALIGEILALSLQILTDARVVGKNAVRVAPDSLNIGVSSGVVVLTLHVFVLLHIHLVPVHHGVVLIAALLHLVCKLRVLLRNPDLFLQPLFFIVKFSQAILEHLRLNLLLFHV